MGSSFSLLHPISLHDLAVTVYTNIPATARLGLAVQHGGVCNIIVLKHTFLELTLWSEVLLLKQSRWKKGERCCHCEQPKQEKKNNAKMS